MSGASGKEYLLQEAQQLVQQCRGLSQRVSTYCNRIVGEADAYSIEIKSLQQSITNTGRAALADRSCSSEEQTAIAALLTEAKDVVQGLGPGGDLRKFLRPRNPLLIRLLLGDKINLVAVRRDHSLAMKEDYHRFRDSSAWVMLLGPLTLFLGLERADTVKANPSAGFHTPTMTPWFMTGIQVYLAWMAYFYLAMALRESILRVNGSKIRGWWVAHHYWSSGASVVLLGLPIHSPAVQGFFRHFMIWSCFQAGVMFLQNLYQRRRMYTRIALGKNTVMDVVAGESSGSIGQLLILYPLLFSLQAWQFMIGAGVVFKTYPAVLSKDGWLELEPLETDLRGMRGVCLVGIVFSYMAYRNFSTTLATMRAKSQSKSSKVQPPKALKVA